MWYIYLSIFAFIYYKTTSKTFEKYVGPLNEVPFTACLYTANRFCNPYTLGSRVPVKLKQWDTEFAPR